MIVTDASVWVSAMLGNDLHHQATLTWLNSYLITGGDMVAPTLLAAELSGAIALRTQRSRTGRLVLEKLLGFDFLRLVPIDHELGLTAAELAAEYQLRGADSIYVALAYTLEVPLLSWDQEQIGRVQSFLRAGTPGTIFGDSR